MKQAAKLGLEKGDSVYRKTSDGDAIDWPCFIKPLTFVISGAFVIGISVPVGFMFSKRIKRIDMAGVLKGPE